MFVEPGFLQGMHAFAQEGKLKIRTSLYLRYNRGCNIFGDWHLDHPPILDPAQMLRIPGVKIFEDSACDGGGAPAWSLELPGRNLSLTEEELTNVVAQAQNNGYQAAIHAIHDRSVETALTAIENALAGAPNTYRHRIEHNTWIRPELLTRYGQIGIVASVPLVGTCGILAVLR